MLQLKQSSDGYGFRYGTIDIGGEAPLRVEIMPPEPLWQGHCNMRLPGLRLPDPKLWAVFIDGEEIGREAGEQEAFDLVQRHADKARSQIASLGR